MKAAVYFVPERHHANHLGKMADGLRRHGIEVSLFNAYPDLTADFAVVWGARVMERIRQDGFSGPVLVMERGFIGDRFSWTSLGWNGLNGRARWNEPQDNGERFWSNFGHLVNEWEAFGGYALLIGQVDGDMALRGVNFAQWCRQAIDVMTDKGMDVRFRPHPEAVKRGQPLPVTSAPVLDGTLADALSGAACVITWNSNTAVEAVLAGVPAVAADEGSMAWPVAAHEIGEIAMPDREEWFRAMSWRQWAMDEVADGSAWDVVRAAM